MKRLSARQPLRQILRWLWHKPHYGFIGGIEYLTGQHWIFNPYGGGPMNGQTARLEIVRCILEQCGVTRIVETGTYRGTTTDWLSQFGLPVVTAEISPRYAVFSRARLKHRRNVEVRPRDSVTVLRELSRELVDRSAPTFLYLDAHWRDHLPLKEELDLISATFPKAIVMIDDFKVPDDAGYGYDDYGPGKVLEMSFLRACNVTPDVIFFPSVPSDWETGSKRGCVVLAYDSALVMQLKQVPLLRTYEMPHPVPGIQKRRPGMRPQLVNNP